MENLMNAIGRALAHIDQQGPQNGNFRPGIGPLRENQLVSKLKNFFNLFENENFPNTSTHRLPDFLIPNMWAIEFKVVRPFGDDDAPAEHWSIRMLHPYPGNRSLIGDLYRLQNLDLNIRKAVIAITFEHQEPRISLDPLIQTFELIAAEICGFNLTDRIEVIVPNLIHPTHQVAKIYGWEILP